MALHVTTEVGKVGRKERERRHYNEGRGHEPEVRRGRKYIDPGFGDQPEWHPHVLKKKVEYTENGLDWKSRARFIPPPKHYEGEYPAEVTLPKLRCYPDKNCIITTTNEWTAYPEGFHNGRKCNFDKSGDVMHLASATSNTEITHTMMLGKNRKLKSVLRRRGSIPAASGGDKSYQAPEYSTNFHHEGSARPIVNFGGSVRLKTDTFVPLQDLPSESCEPFRYKERRRKYASEIESVMALNDWTPAPQLMATSF